MNNFSIRTNPQSEIRNSTESPCPLWTWEKIGAPASRRHARLDNSFCVVRTVAGWKPALHFFSRPVSVVKQDVLLLQVTVW